jgi:hypothetical protein
MKSLLVLLALGLLTVLPGSAIALGADLSTRTHAVSPDTLAEMGLAGMQTVSDREGERIRGERIRFSMINSAILWRPGILVQQRITVGPRHGVFAVSTQSIFIWP